MIIFHSTQYTYFLKEVIFIMWFDLKSKLTYINKVLHFESIIYSKWTKTFISFFFLLSKQNKHFINRTNTSFDLYILPKYLSPNSHPPLYIIRESRIFSFAKK